MSVQTIVRSLERFSGLSTAFGQPKLTTSGPWHFNESPGERIPQENESGIYVFTRPLPSRWKVPLDENHGEAWYVGMSDYAMGARIWSHVGKIYDPETQQPWVPRFKAHRWAGGESIPEDVRTAVSRGDIVVYTIAVTAERMDRLLPQLLEKHVLVEYALEHGSLPPLNLQL